MARGPLHNRILVAITICVASAALAQDNPDKKNEVGGSIGRTYVSNHHVQGLSFDNVVTSGPGLSFEITYARHLWESDLFQLSAEVPILFDLDQDENLRTNLIPGDYSAIFLTPAARLKFFPRTFVSPWISAGGGFGHFSSSSTLEFGGPNPGQTGTTTGVAQFGAGIDATFFGGFTFRGEVRDFYSGVAPLNVNIGMTREHNLFAGGGFVWHF